MLFGKAEIQPWNEPQEEHTNSNSDEEKASKVSMSLKLKSVPSLFH